MRNKRSVKFWIDAPPWLIIGAVVFITLVFIFMTLQSIGKQKEITTRLLVEKGDALIRSFEAGIRTGDSLQWSSFDLQKLLIEIAQQPGIDYMILTDAKGSILADSEPSLVGEYHGTDLEPGSVSAEKVGWRQVPNPEGADTFEVYRMYYPAGRESPAWIVFVGLDLGPVLDARARDARNTVVMALTLLLVGLAGIVSLLFAARYRSARTSLSRVKAFSDSLVENMPIGIVALDREKRIVSFNQTAEETLKLSSGDVMGKRADLVLPENCGELLKNLNAGSGIIEKEIGCTVAGSSLTLEVIAARLEDDDGSLLGNVILFRDLTEIVLLRTEVERNRRLASIGSLAAGVAHEVRNPLSSIKGFATYFREKYRMNPEDLKTAEIMVQEVERLNRVIGQLLDLSRPPDLNLEKKEIGQVILHTLKMVEEQAHGKNVVLRSDLAALDPRETAALIDSDKIKQVLLNLFFNALGAMENGGILSVALRPDSGRKVRIDVSDTGTGIRKEDLPRIFDPYFTTRPAGAGLGLAIVQKIVEAHNGEIRVESEPGKGTTFSVLLPVSEA
ncbi:MAG TPA: ATP-binding protein [Syntrophales bacterium]|nr:ATP-binding protein [Syntrophales bacterium]